VPLGNTFLTNVSSPAKLIVGNSDTNMVKSNIAITLLASLGNCAMVCNVIPCFDFGSGFSFDAFLDTQQEVTPYLLSQE
jgi:hypothetical protein